MEKDYSLPDYDDPRRWINTAREKGKSWDYIEFAGKNSETGLKEFIRSQADINWWKIDEQDWHELVKLQKLSEEKTKMVSIVYQEAMITGPGEDGTLTLPTDPHSSWQLYRNLLLTEKHFRPEAVSELGKSTLGILNRLKAKLPVRQSKDLS